ncbi:uncharacterized protein GIQ15_00905 [Arthroderma uncinatum]|uniref:uncharacterized protein n=1 Tax=Arthroderma uncinatum TaxID=74035 RepID=UPI00144A5E87|nr:uncharacterized protein GIQ15_00905 [Arthroderma uncinatum]KAF3491388.1 hypothetical protein GIQ15_00905 [Arthroderma uncinatum]
MRLLHLLVAVLPLAYALPAESSDYDSILKDAAGNTVRVPRYKCTRPEGLSEIQSIKLSPLIRYCYLYSDAECTNGKIVEVVRESTDQVKRPEAGSISCRVAPKSKPGKSFKNLKGKGRS